MFILKLYQQTGEEVFVVADHIRWFAPLNQGSKVCFADGQWMAVKETNDEILEALTATDDEEVAMR